jgi:CRISPR-associated protein Csb1
MEEALQTATDTRRLSIPVIEAYFSTAKLLRAIGKVTRTQAPHRIADAILRDSLLDGKPFRETTEGMSLSKTSPVNATDLYRFCPTALIFGLWDSTGPMDGTGAKFRRAIMSEIVGVGAVYGVKTSSRIDPLQALKPV